MSVLHSPTVVDCLSLPDPSNGAVMFNTTTFESTATYSCDSGYSRNGSETRMCGSDGMWTPVAPTCDGK